MPESQRPTKSVSAQEEQLRTAGCEVVYSDVMTGTVGSRPQWDACLKGSRKEDTLVITKLDRAGRSLKHLMEVSEDLTNRGVELKVLDQGIDTSTAPGRLMLQMLGAVSEFEAALISERTKAAIAGRVPVAARVGDPRRSHPAPGPGRRRSTTHVK